MALPTQLKLTQHLIRWNGEIADFEKARTAYGETKANLKHLRAVIGVKEKARNPRIAVSLLELIADADDEVYRLTLEHEAASAAVDVGTVRLRWCSAMADGLRSEISTERAEAQLYADNRSEP